MLLRTFALPEVITSASHMLPSAPVLEKSPEVETHVAPLLASVVPALSIRRSTDASPKRAKLRVWTFILLRDWEFARNSAYLIASAFGGEPTPPGTLSGADVRKKS